VTGRAAATLTSFAYRSAWAAASRLPDGWGAPAIGRVADRIVARRGPAVVQLAKNLRRVLGSDATPAALHAATRAAMRSYGRYWWETFRLHRLDPHAVARKALAGTVGVEHVQAARDAGRGFILALPHSGNWDIAGLSMVELLGGITTVAEKLKPESLYRRFVSYREQLGFEVLPLGADAGSSAGTAGVLRRRLEQGRMVCLLADRDLAGNGVPVTFFGEPTTMPAGPALLAARTGADLCPVHLAYTDDGWLQFVGAPLTLHGARLADQVKSGTQQLADAFAERIALFPADWHMLQPLWPADRPTVAQGAPGRAAS
jgi:KDO2-lipid IV(A) lauroyltransferase